MSGEMFNVPCLIFIGSNVKLFLSNARNTYSRIPADKFLKVPILYHLKTYTVAKRIYSSAL